MLRIETAGAIRVISNDTVVPLPRSRKTRALLAYLALAPHRHSRQRLCEFLWELPDDPRAALRWSLTKLRPILNSGGRERLIATRDSVQLDVSDVRVDIDDITGFDLDTTSPDKAASLWERGNQILLEDCELPNQPEFSAWLALRRNALVRSRIDIARHHSLQEAAALHDRERWVERWRSDAPFDPEAAQLAVALRRKTGRHKAATTLARQIIHDFNDAGLPMPDLSAAADEQLATARNDASDGEPELPRQSIRFVRSDDGVSLAWASIGDSDNPPLVKAANWLTHLERDWDAPIWSPLFGELAKHYHFVRYDGRGCGLSDWHADRLTLDGFVEDLKSVVDAAGLDRFPLMGISQGGAVSIEFAARYPERVTHLILFGAYDQGWRYTATEAETREREAIMILTESGWGSDNPAYRHLFSQTFMPDATADELAWFDEFQRHTTSPRNAVRFLDAFSRIDVKARLSQVRCPTLVAHSSGDQRIPLATARRLAMSINGARFAALDSANHLLLGREPASAALLRLIRDMV